MTVAELEERIDAAEFEEWREYFQLEMRELTPERIYLARLLAETRRSWVAKPKDVNDDDFIVRFRGDDGEEPIKIDGHQMKRVFQLAFGGKA